MTQPFYFSIPRRSENICPYRNEYTNNVHIYIMYIYTQYIYIYVSVLFIIAEKWKSIDEQKMKCGLSIT